MKKVALGTRMRRELDEFLGDGPRKKKEERKLLTIGRHVTTAVIALLLMGVVTNAFSEWSEPDIGGTTIAEGLVLAGGPPAVVPFRTWTYANVTIAENYFVTARNVSVRFTFNATNCGRVEMRNGTGALLACTDIGAQIVFTADVVAVGAGDLTPQWTLEVRFMRPGGYPWTMTAVG